MLTLALLVTLFVTEKADMISFLGVMEQHAPSVTAMAISCHDQQISANRSKLLAILKSILFVED